jgi:multicomponent Na+:H+ antiporter subunit D
MVGLPPAAGFVSKWYMLGGALQAQHWVAITVIAASTLLNAAYFAPIVYRAFFRAPQGAAHGEAPLPMVLALRPMRSRTHASLARHLMLTDRHSWSQACN